VQARKEGLLFREKEAKSFCLSACTVTRSGSAKVDTGGTCADIAAGEEIKAFWSFFSKKDCLLRFRQSRNKTQMPGAPPGS
jgi:hypothetical protein